MFFPDLNPICQHVTTAAEFVTQNGPAIAQGAAAMAQIAGAIVVIATNVVPTFFPAGEDGIPDDIKDYKCESCELRVRSWWDTRIMGYPLKWPLQYWEGSCTNSNCLNRRASYIRADEFYRLKAVRQADLQR